MTSRTMPYNCIKKKSGLLFLYGKERYKEISFTDEKIFTVEETFNKQPRTGAKCQTRSLSCLSDGLVGQHNFFTVL